MSGRRAFLKTVVGSAAALAVASCATSGSGTSRAKPTPLTPTRLNDRFVLITGAGGNVLTVAGPDGLLMVDGGLAERSSELLKLAYAQSGAKRVHTLFNTHWHWDHTGSNESLGKVGTKIIAHENTKLWLGADFFVEWENRAYKPRPAYALPSETFYTNGKLSFANEEVVYGYLPRAHTDGDIYVFFPGSNVLVTGGLMSVGNFPILDYTTGGWIGGLLDATKALLEVANAETRIIPAAGPVQTRADLQAQADMLATVKDRLVGLMRKGMGAEDMLAADATREFNEKWGDPKLFVSNAYKGLWGHVRELGGIV